MENFISKLNWRYAVKKYDPTKKVSEDNLIQIKEAIRLSPSSHGLQPYRVLFIEDETLRTKLKTYSYNQPQITDASHLLVFAIENNINEEYINQYFENLIQTRNVKLEGNLLRHKNSTIESISKMSEDEKRNWATNQTYIALGNLLFAAAQLEIDANPMEGFIPSAYDEVLELANERISSVVIAAIGYRHKFDVFQNFIKVRKSSDKLFIVK